MQLFTFLIIVCVFVSSCHNESKKASTDQTETISEEAQLIEGIKQYPDSLLLRENLIQYYRKNDNYDNALAVANKVLEKDSTLARFWDIKAILYFEKDDTLNAIKSYERAMNIFPAPEYLMSLGSLYAATKNPKALNMADALMADNKLNATKEALFIKGLYYNYVGNKSKAIEFFDECLYMDYTFMFAYREKAIALYDIRQYDEAIKVLKKAVTLQNNFDEGYYWMGRCLEKQHKINEAIEEYRVALFYNKNYIEAQDALARLGVQ